METQSGQGAGKEQPWYVVRSALLISLATLITVLATLLSFPELIDLVHASIL